MVNYAGLTATPNYSIFNPLLMESDSIGNGTISYTNDLKPLFSDNPIYPVWVSVYGWLIFLVILSPIPIFAFFIVKNSKGKTILEVRVK